MVNGLVDKIKKFFAETNVEFNKIIWPGRQYVIVATIVILIIVIAMAFFVMGADFVFSKLMDLLIKIGSRGA